MSNIDFLCIGAQKAGTTWLFNRLNELPEFTLLPVKEVHYFDRNPRYYSPNTLSITNLSERIMDTKWKEEAITKLNSFSEESFEHSWYQKWYFSDYNDDWYISLFDNLKGIRGEITPAYSILDKSDVGNL